MEIKQKAVSAFNMILGVATIYGIYKKLKDLSEAKKDIYNQLSPELQAKWDKVFGTPKSEVVIVKNGETKSTGEQISLGV